MINLGNRIIDEDGNVVYFTTALMELLYNGFIPSEILFPKDDTDVVLFNKNNYENYDDIEYTLPKTVERHDSRKNRWFYPDRYDVIDLEQYFLNLCKNDLERNRVLEELKVYREKGFEKFLRFCIFFSDKIKENDWVIGIGRGSNVASYILYLLKIHLVNSLEYGLDIKEFLK